MDNQTLVEVGLTAPIITVQKRVGRVNVLKACKKNCDLY